MPKTQFSESKCHLEFNPLIYRDSVTKSGAAVSTLLLFRPLPKNRRLNLILWHKQAKKKLNEKYKPELKIRKSITVSIHSLGSNLPIAPQWNDNTPGKEFNPETSEIQFKNKPAEHEPSREEVQGEQAMQGIGRTNLTEEDAKKVKSDANNESQVAESDCSEVRNEKDAAFFVGSLFDKADEAER